MKNQIAVSSKKVRHTKKILVLLPLFVILFQLTASATGISIDLTSDGAGGFEGLDLLFLFAFLSLAPSLLVMMTSFTRIVIVFSFLRSALSLQQVPPNQVVVGIALFLSLFIMNPIITEINETAIEPYTNGIITQEVALENMSRPIKKFMLTQIREPELDMFLSLAGQEYLLMEELSEESLLNLGFEIIVPAFITRELKNAFTIGFLLFLPFLVIDLVVASTLMSMGMVMLPPSMISLPFKVMLFVVVDGWSLIIEMLVESFL